MKRLRALGFAAAILTAASAVALAGDSDVIVRLNGGDNVAYIGETNTIEVLVSHDVPVTEMTLAFRSSSDLNLFWTVTDHLGWTYQDEFVNSFDWLLANGVSGGDITVGDVSAFIGHLFINRQPLPDCP